MSFTSSLLLAAGGLWFYFRQKEYEIVKQRYLEQTLDVISGELEQVTSAFLHNWVRCLDLLKEYREAPDTFDPDRFSHGFVPLNASKLNRSAHHRLQVLLASKAFWSVYQFALSHHLGLNSTLVNEVPLAIRRQLAGKLSVTQPELIDRIMSELAPMPSTSDRFAVLHSALLRLSSELESRKMSFRQISSFAKRPTVSAILAEVTTFYAEDLAKYVEVPPNNSSKPKPLRGAA